MKKRVISLLLATLLMLSVILTGCVAKAPQSDNQTGTTAQTDNAVSTTKPAEPEEPVKIQWIGMPVGSLYPEDDALVVKEIEKRFNVDIEVVKTNPNRLEELNLMFASGVIPDHIHLNQADLNMVLEEGLLREVSEQMVKEIAPTYYNLAIENHPYVFDSIAYNKATNAFLAIPQGQGELYPLTTIRTDWLKKVGAQMPTNLDEFEEICRLFTEADPDGDGNANTYAFAALENRDVYTLAAAFGIHLPMRSVTAQSYVKCDDGVVRAAEVTENYKELMKYVARLYKKGYLYPDVTTTSGNALFTNGTLGMKTFDWTYFIVDNRPNDWYALTFQQNPNATCEFLKPLTGYNGKEAVYEQQAQIWKWQCFGKNTTDAQVRKVLEIIETMLTDMEFHNIIWRGYEVLITL
ncbi:MAG TPA: extracellular solute-binding protein [Clostridiaceae bacterium]|nr:extracellular solute-binding protein [Clostridiaceae bacterium]